jgi:hyaluronan synthase
VAAVAAHGFVANAWVNFLTRMQAVQYYIAFRVMKAAESVFASVTCCSGCLAAYRKSAVMEVLDDWLHQRFLGRPATFGDDRSLTNFMLRRHKVIYDSTSHVWTIVPESFRQFFRQQLRWKKSWLRETVRAASFMWRRPPLMVFSFFGGLIFPLLAPIILLRTFLYLPLTSGSLNFTYLWGVMLMSMLYSAYYLILQRNRMWIYGIGLCFFYSLILTWQLPWAIITSWNNKWGTR